MKHVLVIAALILHINAHGQTAIAQPEVSAASKIKELTVPQFLKQLSAMQQNANGELLNVIFVPKTKDAIVVAYNGANHREIQSALDLMTTGDRISIESKNKSAGLPSQSFLIKK